MMDYLFYFLAASAAYTVGQMTSLPRIKLAAALLCTCCAALWLHSPATSGDSAGAPVRVVDGDSLAQNNQDIRLHGINAPEWDQLCVRFSDCESWPCGQEATQELARLTAGHAVTCETRGDAADKYDRRLAECFVPRAGGQRLSVNRYLVEFGFAAAYLHYSEDYAGEHAAARRKKRGIHSGYYADPSRWHRMNGDEKAAFIAAQKSKCLALKSR